MTKTLDLRQIKEDAESFTEEKKTQVIDRKLTLSISYDAPDGETYQDDIVSEILTSDTRLTKTRVFNRLTQGMIVSTLPQGEQLRLEALARLVTQVKDAPAWVIKWAGEDMDLLSDLNAALVEHETRYFRGNSRQGEGGEIKPRILINSALSEEAGATLP